MLKLLKRFIWCVLRGRAHVDWPCARCGKELAVRQVKSWYGPWEWRAHCPACKLTGPTRSNKLNALGMIVKRGA